MTFSHCTSSPPPGHPLRGRRRVHVETLPVHPAGGTCQVSSRSTMAASRLPGRSARARPTPARRPRAPTRRPGHPRQERPAPPRAPRRGAPRATAASSSRAASNPPPVGRPVGEVAQVGHRLDLSGRQLGRRVVGVGSEGRTGGAREQAHEDRVAQARVAQRRYQPRDLCGCRVGRRRALAGRTRAARGRRPAPVQGPPPLEAQHRRFGGGSARRTTRATGTAARRQRDRPRPRRARGPRGPSAPPSGWSRGRPAAHRPEGSGTDRCSRGTATTRAPRGRPRRRVPPRLLRRPRHAAPDARCGPGRPRGGRRAVRRPRPGPGPRAAPPSARRPAGEPGQGLGDDATVGPRRVTAAR